MKADSSLGHRDVEQAFLEHQGCAAAFALRHAFLRGLEDQQDLSRQAIAQLDQHFGDAHEDRGMRVVTAGMHDADGATAKFPGRRRTERHIGLLGHRQGIHVGPQQDRGTGTAALDHRDDARVGHAGPDIEPERAQVFGHLARGPDFAICEFRVEVKIAAPLDDTRLDRGRGPVEFGRRDVGVRDTGRQCTKHCQERKLRHLALPKVAGV